LRPRLAHLEQQRESAENVLDDLESELDNLDSALQSGEGGTCEDAEEAVEQALCTRATFGRMRKR